MTKQEQVHREVCFAGHVYSASYSGIMGMLLVPTSQTKTVGVESDVRGQGVRTKPKTYCRLKKKGGA